VHFLVTVAVLAYASGGGGERATAEAELARALRARGATVVEDARERASMAHARGEPAWIDRAALGFFAQAARHVGDGREALARVELARAEAELAAAERLYAPELARPGVASEAATAALWRGVALFELGRRGEAERAWRRAVALEPTTVLTEAMVRPDAARAFATALHARPLADLVVVARRGDEPMPFFVDGVRHQGDDRLRLPVGEHLVASNRAAWLIEVPGVGTTVRIDYARDEVGAALARLDAAPDDAGLMALRNQLGLDGVLVASVAVDGEARAYAAAWSRPGCVTATLSDSDAATLLRRLEAAPCAPGRLERPTAPTIARGARPARATATRAARAERARRGWQRPWIWMTAVGALAVGVVVGVTLWPRAPTYSATLDFHQFSLAR
jgi:hypothetical protein